MLTYLVAAFLVIPIIPTILLVVAARKKLAPVFCKITRRDTRGTDRGASL